MPLLQWTPSANDPPTGYELRAGATPDALGPIRLPLPGSATSFSTAGAPPGVHFVAIAATSPCGVSMLSNIVRVIVAPPGAPPPPSGLSASITERVVVRLTWTPPAGTVSGYTLEAGTAPGLANLVPGLAVGPAPFVIVPNLPPRRYFVRVRAASGGPLSAPSNEILVDVP